MSKGSILVIGTGFIGARVVRKLVAEGQNVVCFDSKPDLTKIQDLDVKVIQGNIMAIEELFAAIHDYKIDCIAALAYLMPGECEENPHLAIRVNALGINNIFEAAHLTKVKRVVYTSTAGVVGLQPEHGEKMLTEDDFGRCSDLYAVLKQLNEFVAQKYNSAYGMDIRILRPSNIMGHGRKALIAWGGKIVSEPAAGKPVHINYPSSSKICPVYIDDVVDLIVLLCLRDNVRYQVYNASGHITTMGELANTIREYIPDAQISFNEAGKLYEEVHAAYSIDNRRAVSEFGWQPRSLREAVLAHTNEARAEAGLAPVSR